MDQGILFEPFKIGKLEINGRVVKTATSETRASKEGFVTDELLAFYEPLAYAGTPLIISGNLYVSPQGTSTVRMCGIDHDNKLPGLEQWAKLAHQNGSRFFAQLNHCGRQVVPEALGMANAVSASDVQEKIMGTKPRPLTTQEIRETAGHFADAAERAQKAGFDGVQLHMGHGYLLNQFLTPYTNRRKDEYGGSFEGRLRFPIEVLHAVRKRVGPDYPVIAKLNGSDDLVGRDGLSNDDLVKVAQALEKESLDGVEITVGHYESGMGMIRGKFDGFIQTMLKEGGGQYLPRFRRNLFLLAGPMVNATANQLWPTQEGFNLRFARKFKKALGIPVICVGGFITRDAMAKAISDDLCDAVSIARAMIADPFLYKHMREGTTGPQCDFCNGCIARAGGMPVDCYNDQVRAERDRMLQTAGVSH